jgi:hypothetical protein
VRSKLHLFLIAFILAGALTTLSPVKAGPPYYYRWSFAPNATCTQNVGFVAVGLASQPVEWDLPVGNQFMIVYIDNGVASPTGPFTRLPGTGSQVFGAFQENVAGTYPVTFDFRLDTYVNGILVYQSTLSVSCAADSASITPTLTSAVVTPPPSPSSSSSSPAVPGPDMVALPSGSVVGSFVTTTPAYFAPSTNAVTTITIEAGKTLWVLGVDSSGDFYKVVMAGRYFWVPVDTMGPNFDNVWQGRPLPTNVIS